MRGRLYARSPMEAAPATIARAAAQPARESSGVLGAQPDASTPLALAISLARVDGPGIIWRRAQYSYAR